MNLANKITLLRIALIPIFIVMLTLKIRYSEYIAASVFIVLSLSDAVDGYIARKKRQITTFGKFIDPLADKLLIAAALIFLIGKGVEPWMAYAIIAREFIVTGLRLVAISKYIVINVSLLGKAKTIIQSIAIVAIIINFPFAWHFMLIAVAITALSGLEYIIKFRKVIEE